MLTHKQKNIKYKNIILLVIMAIILVMSLWGTVFTRSIPQLDVYSAISGIDLIMLIASGGKVSYSTVYFVFNYTVPISVAVVYLIYIIVSLVVIALTIAGLVKGKNVPKIGFAVLALAIIIVGYYTFLTISSTLTSINEDNIAKPFYTLFELSPVLLVIAILLFIVSAIYLKLDYESISKVKRYLPLYLLLVLPTIFILIFNIYPMILQLLMTFKDYNAGESIFQAQWVGMANFVSIINYPGMSSIIFNTVWISLLRIFIGTIPAIVLSILLFEVQSERLRKIIQTVIYTPHFFSWVIIFAISTAFLGADGIINNLLADWGLIDASQAQSYLKNENAFLPIVLITSLWKDLGWGTILYLAALYNVDMSQYEAAAIDGAGPLKKLWHITLPSIMPVIVFLTIMAVGNLLKGAGGEQLLLFKSPEVDSIAQVIDTWVYEVGLKKSLYGPASAISFVQAGLGIIMVLASNKLSTKAIGVGLW